MNRAPVPFYRSSRVNTSLKYQVETDWGLSKVALIDLSNLQPITPSISEVELYSNDRVVFESGVTVDNPASCEINKIENLGISGGELKASSCRDGICVVDLKVEEPGYLDYKLGCELYLSPLNRLTVKPKKVADLKLENLELFPWDAFQLASPSHYQIDPSAVLEGLEIGETQDLDLSYENCDSTSCLVASKVTGNAPGFYFASRQTRAIAHGKL